ncbi:MAG: hypothetical protein R6V01_09790 [Thermoplasmatota archaeon]
MMNSKRKFGGILLGSIIIAMMVLPGTVLAISNEQVIGGYHFDPGFPIKAQTNAIDSIEDDVVAVFSQEKQVGGPYNIYLQKSTDGGVNWQPSLIQLWDSNLDQKNPDVVMIDMEGTKVVFIVWDEANILYATARYFNNLSVWGGGSWGDLQMPKRITESDGEYNFPRITGRYYTGSVNDEYGSWMYVHIVWEAYISGQGAWTRYEIQMRTFLWENLGGTESLTWSNEYTAAQDLENYDLRHPTIDVYGAQFPLVLTYDCENRGTGQIDVRLVPLWYSPMSVYYQGYPIIPNSLQNVVFQSQPYYYFPEVTLYENSDQSMQTIITGQSWNGLAGSILARAYNYFANPPNDFGNLLTVGSSTAAPSLKGVGIDSTEPDQWFIGGIKVIWASTSEVRSNMLTANGTQISVCYRNPPPPDPYYVDTTGLYDGAITYVAISMTHIYATSTTYAHQLYCCTGRDIIYYRDP